MTVKKSAATFSVSPPFAPLRLRAFALNFARERVLAANQPYDFVYRLISESVEIVRVLD